MNSHTNTVKGFLSAALLQAAIIWSGCNTHTHTLQQSMSAYARQITHMHTPDWANEPQAVGAAFIPVLAAQLISCLTENVIVYAASVLLWFQARYSLTERAERGGCLKVMFSQIPRYTCAHTHTHTHTSWRSWKHCLCSADSLLPLSHFFFM